MINHLMNNIFLINLRNSYLFWYPTLIKLVKPESVWNFSVIFPWVISGGGESNKGCKIALIWPDASSINFQVKVKSKEKYKKIVNKKISSFKNKSM